MNTLVQQGYGIEGETMEEAIERASQGFIKGEDEECAFHNPSTGMGLVLWAVRNGTDLCFGQTGMGIAFKSFLALDNIEKII